MTILNRIRGEEPSIFRKIPHMLEGKGHYGEYLADYALNSKTIVGRHETYTNLLVPRKGGATETSELDVLMLHEKGFYVVEVKNYSGWIFGSVDQRQWTVCYEGGRKEHFYNPIKQNRAHVRALAAYLGIDEHCFMSFIVFSEKCDLKKVPVDTADYQICRQHMLAKYISWDLDAGEVLFSPAEFDALKARLDALAARSTEAARDEHVAQAQRVAAGVVCPWCGRDLIERRRKADGGTFIGCSGFPACRYTRREW